MFRNIGTEISDAEESPKRKNTTLFIDVIFCLCMPVTTLDLLLCSWTNQPDIPTLPFCVHGQITPTYQHCPFAPIDKSARQTNTAPLCPWTNHPDRPTLPFCIHGQISPTKQHCPFVSMDKSARQANTALFGIIV